MTSAADDGGTNGEMADGDVVVRAPDIADSESAVSCWSPPLVLTSARRQGGPVSTRTNHGDQGMRTGMVMAVALLAACTVTVDDTRIIDDPELGVTGVMTTRSGVRRPAEDGVL